jgi:hypothetical protein
MAQRGTAAARGLGEWFTVEHVVTATLVMRHAEPRQLLPCPCWGLCAHVCVRERVCVSESVGTRDGCARARAPGSSVGARVCGGGKGSVFSLMGESPPPDSTHARCGVAKRRVHNFVHLFLLWGPYRVKGGGVAQLRWWAPQPLHNCHFFVSAKRTRARCVRVTEIELALVASGYWTSATAVLVSPLTFEVTLVAASNFPYLLMNAASVSYVG